MSRHNRRRADAETRRTGTRVVIFFRKDTWYPLELPVDEDLSKHAELNPGTLRIETVHGKLLWAPS
jgi:hypothetical protein